MAEDAASEISARKCPLNHRGGVNALPRNFPGVAKTADAAYSKHALWRFESSPLDCGILWVQKRLPYVGSIYQYHDPICRKFDIIATLLALLFVLSLLGSIVWGIVNMDFEPRCYQSNYRKYDHCKDFYNTRLYIAKK